MNRSLAVLLLLSTLPACGAAHLTLKERFPLPPLRYALAAREPRVHRAVLGVALSVHDSDPSGAKPAIVCLHAGGHGGGDFNAFEDAFADRYRIITVDWPGQGASGEDTQPASAPRYAALFTALADDLKLGSFVILGNSIGGAVAIRYAAAHPERVRGLILSNPGGLDPGGFIPSLYIRYLEGHFRGGAEGKRGYLDWFAGYYEGILSTPVAEPRRRAIVAAGYETAAVLEQAWASFRAPEADIRELVPQVHAPVLVAWAKDDGIIRWSRNKDAIARFPNAKVVQLPGGHSPFLEAPAEFNATAGPFLEGLAR